MCGGFCSADHYGRKCEYLGGLGEVVYIRHGQASLFSDNYDLLSEKGKNQATIIGSYLQQKETRVDKIYVGPLTRHVQTMEAIIENYQDLRTVDVEEVKGLCEHQGYKTLTALLPQLKEKDERIRKLANLSATSREEKIANHIKLYDHFSLRWAKGEFNHLTNGNLQSWPAFFRAASDAYTHIWENTGEGQKVLVITSGGPTAVAYGKAKNLTQDEILHFSSSLYNGSCTHFTRKRDEISVKSANSVDHYHPDEDLVTLV